MSVQGALQQWLGELILVEAVQVESLEEAVQVTVHYLVRQTQQRQVARFEKSV